MTDNLIYLVILNIKCNNALLKHNIDKQLLSIRFLFKINTKIK